MTVLEYIPELFLYGFAAFLAGLMVLAAWKLWRIYYPAAPGIIYGVYEIVGYTPDGEFHRRFKGRIVDATSLFLSPDTAAYFKRALLRMLVSLRSTSMDEEERKLYSESYRKLEEYPASDLTKICRVLAMRSYHKKQVFIQWGYVEPVTNYASIERERQVFSFGFGWESKGEIRGYLKTLPGTWKVYKMGRSKVHLFMPTPRSMLVAPFAKQNPGKFVEPPDWFANVLRIPLSVESSERIEALEQQLAQKERELMEMRRDLAIISTDRDNYKRMAELAGGGEIPKSTLPKQVDVTDFLAVAVPTIIGSYLAPYVNVEAILGVFSGLATGFFILWRRRSK